jgi:hypothetical protein
MKSIKNPSRAQHSKISKGNSAGQTLSGQNFGDEALSQ